MGPFALLDLFASKGTGISLLPPGYMQLLVDLLKQIIDQEQKRFEVYVRMQAALSSAQAAAAAAAPPPHQQQQQQQAVLAVLTWGRCQLMQARLRLASPLIWAAMTMMVSLSYNAASHPSQFVG